MSHHHRSSHSSSQRPTEANNSAEREAQVEAITARVMRLRAQTKAAPFKGPSPQRKTRAHPRPPKS